MRLTDGMIRPMRARGSGSSATRRSFSATASISSSNVFAVSKVFAVSGYPSKADWQPRRLARRFRQCKIIPGLGFGGYHAFDVVRDDRDAGGRYGVALGGLRQGDEGAARLLRRRQEARRRRQ